MTQHDSRGFSLLELLVSMTVLLMVMIGVAGMLIQNSQINRVEQMTVEAQSNARNCLAMVVAKLRSAGWDPLNVNIPTVALDPDLGDDISEIEVFADLNKDGETDGTVTDDDDGEQILIRHFKNQVEWRPSADVGDPFVVLARNISNDADGDGTPEPMFVPDSTVDPERITVQITAQSPKADSRTGQFVRYTVTSQVVLRKEI
jgi:prepilin-type N-terminal cleavage/methylation domain-containing protein